MKTKKELVACVARELALRERAYPKWIGFNKISADKARHEIECMKEVLKHIQALPDDLAQETLELGGHP